MNRVIKQSNDSEVPIETEQNMASYFKSLQNMASYFKSLLEGPNNVPHVNPQPEYE